MQRFQIALAAVATATTLSLSTMAPASADSAASTRNIILGAVAIAGIAIESNVAHKHAQAAAISRYLPDGSAIYGDGRIIAANGYSSYPGDEGQRVNRFDDGHANNAARDDPNRGDWNNDFSPNRNFGFSPDANRDRPEPGNR